MEKKFNDKLNQNMLLTIFSFLSYADILKISKINKKLKSIANDSQIFPLFEYFKNPILYIFINNF